MYTEKNLSKEFNLSVEKSHSISSASKKVIIMIIMLFLLLIPSGLINALVKERENRQKDVYREVSQSWGVAQQVTGPVLSIPYDILTEQKVFEKDNNGNRRAVTKSVVSEQGTLHIMPEAYNVDGELIPTEKARGIFKATVYTADLSLDATFQRGKVEEFLQRRNVSLKYKEAYLTMGLTNMNGVKNSIPVTANGKKLEITPGSKLKWSAPQGVTILVDASVLSQRKPLKVHSKLRFIGSDNISIVPIGQTNKINVRSSWKHPSFSGTYLPEPNGNSENDFKNGFNASWNIFNYDQVIPKMFTLDSSAYTKNVLRINLIQSVDGYQKVSRTTKYAILFILLTFVTFFTIEIKNKKPLHPIQYLLIGLAISIFYTLLLSITEQTNFGIAYLAASSAVTLLITGYSHSIFKNHRVTMIIFGSFSTLYGILYTILQQEDKALLFGSVSLFVALALVMFFTRDVDWYNVGKEKDLYLPEVEEE